MFLSVWLVCENLDIRVQRMRLSFSGGASCFSAHRSTGKVVADAMKFFIGRVLASMSRAVQSQPRME